MHRRYNSNKIQIKKKLMNQALKRKNLSEFYELYRNLLDKEDANDQLTTLFKAKINIMNKLFLKNFLKLEIIERELDSNKKDMKGSALMLEVSV
jgi:hypothetical protein